MDRANSLFLCHIGATLIPKANEFEQYSQEHLHSPKPGDYWQEHLCPILVVVAVTDDAVLVIDKTKDVDADH